MENGVLSLMVDTDNWKEHCCVCSEKFKVDELELDTDTGFWTCGNCLTRLIHKESNHTLKRLFRLKV